MNSTLTLGLASAAVLLIAFIYKNSRKSLSFLRGPPSPSSLLGHEYEMSHQPELGDPDFEWFREYGTAFRLAGCYGQEILTIADPKALQHILHASSYRYPRSKEFSRLTKKLFGRGILWAEGSVHQRHRKVLNPAFSATQLRQFLSVFQQSAGRLTAQWEEGLNGKGGIVDLTKWLPRVTLDVIGATAFDFDFRALEGGSNSDLNDALNNLFADSRGQTKSEVLRKVWLRKIPDFLYEFTSRKFESREELRFKYFLTTAKSIAKTLVKEKGEAKDSGDSGVEKDVLSVLLRSNNAEDPMKRLDDDEILSQITTMILAGHETTANTMTWLLYELSRHPEDQQKIRDEIAFVRSKASADLTSNDYDSMTYLNACIKETLRLHPIVPFLLRDAAQDDVIPLAEPVITSSGQKLSQIPVGKGQRIFISVTNYNRLTTVWGDDAHEWNPSRFLETKKQTSLGVYANLLTFSAGVLACIGWRFAVMEMQAVLVLLIESFEFLTPPGGLDIQAVSAISGPLSPMIRGRLHEGVQMPLFVKPTIKV